MQNLREDLADKFCPGETPKDIEDVISSLENLSVDENLRQRIYYQTCQILGKMTPYGEFGSFLPDLALNIRMYFSSYLWILEPLTSHTAQKIFIILTIFEHFKKHKGVKYQFEVSTSVNITSTSGGFEYVDKIYGVTPCKTPNQGWIKWIVLYENFANVFFLGNTESCVSAGNVPLSLPRSPCVKWYFVHQYPPDDDTKVRFLCSTSTATKMIDMYQQLGSLGFVPKEYLKEHLEHH